ncbi:hypothetical protein TWF970_009015 [Orbilia oligospora]|uniref:Mitochondrial ATPase inhibitor n=1 Tax=Orbilia oligospora TaxID=2813651 RepID=A0A7C8R3T6_ORBOL|nr:hypothetical protein TWF970_009015 [Orbilia oligospora]
MTTISNISRRLPALCTARGSFAYTAATRLSVSSQQQARYSSYSSSHENDPEKLDDYKRNSLKEQKEGKGQWHEELASDAEAFIKAERQEIKATGEEIEKLQRETTKLLKKTGLKA